MTFHKPLLAAALTLFAVPALAECPTGADLRTGITFVDDYGNVETFRAGANGTVRMDGMEPDGYTYGSILGKGVHIVQLFDTENGAIIRDSMINTSYPVPVSSLPVPGANQSWTVETVINSYGDIYAEEQSQRWGAEMTFTVGTCSFRGIPGKIRYVSEGFRIDEEIMFLPDLGMSLLLSYDDTEGPKDSFSYVSVRPAQ